MLMHNFQGFPSTGSLGNLAMNKYVQTYDEDRAHLSSRHFKVNSYNVPDSALSDRSGETGFSEAPNPYAQVLLVSIN